METPIICPFYGKNDDYCDVGCEYISPHDVNMIIRYCNGRHVECSKYMELADRFNGKMQELITAESNIPAKQEGGHHALHPYAESQ